MVSIDAYIWCCGWWLSSSMASIDAYIWCCGWWLSSCMVSIDVLYLVLWVVVELLYGQY